MEKRRKSSFISSSISIALSLISFGLVLYLGYLMFANNLLPLRIRMLILIIFGIFSLLLLLMGMSSGGLARKTFAIILNVILLLFIVVATLFIHSGLSTLNAIQVGGEKSPQPEVTPVEANVSEEGFIVYIAGTDTYGEIGEEGRTDVNILMAVNPNTGQIVIVSIPRDTYVRIPGQGGNEYDKLTHAGNYGVETSIRTLENMLDIEINYFVQMNFTSFMKIIDAVGGIEVDNPESFHAKHTGQFYPEGPIMMKSKEALHFVRERYDLKDGDFGRQRNQALVIEAVFNKVISSELLFNFQGIMDAVQDSIVTNMPTNTIMDFVNFQIDTNNDWEFQSIQLNGADVLGLPSYAMPRAKIYMFVPYEEDIERVHDILKGVVDGSYQIPENAKMDVRSDDNEGKTLSVPVEYLNPDADILNEDDSQPSASSEESQAYYQESSYSSYEKPKYYEEKQESYYEPSYEEPVYEEPVYEEPVYEEPTNNNNYQEPTQTWIEPLPAEESLPSTEVGPENENTEPSSNEPEANIDVNNTGSAGNFEALPSGEGS